METKTNNNIKTENLLPNFKTPSIFLPIAVIIIFLIIMMFLIFYKVKLPNSSITRSNEEITADVLVILSFGLIIFILCVIFLPNFKDIKDLFQQISNVTYVILYTIFLILFFMLMSIDTLNNYAYIITPITILLGVFAFYKSAVSDYVSNFNINYERIKSIILIFCLITSYIVYYNTDPGGYISKYFGYTLLLTIITAVFAFLYLIVVLTLPNTFNNIAKDSKSSNFLENFSSFSVYGSILFVIFLIVMTVLISTYPGGFFNDKTTSGAVMIMLLIISIVWAMLLSANLFPEMYNKNMNIDKINFFKRAILALFGIVISGLLIFWIVYNIHTLSSESSIVSIILNLILVLIFMSLIYKTIYVQLPSGNSKKSGFFNIFINLIFYLPCLFSGIFDSIGSFVSGEYNSSTTGSLLMLLLAIIIIVIYFTTPQMFNKFSSQGGNQLVNKPVYTNSQYVLGTYEQLNGSDKFDYQYAISFWVFIDAVPPNMNPSYEKYTSLLNFGGKPNILYNGSKNTLMITMEQKDLDKNTSNKLTNFDDNGNRIIYKNTNVLLQKWNNIIINYNGGVLDVFLNGELVKSDVGVVPYYTIDNLTIGENDGISGGISNVIYFKHALTASNVYYLYNTVKNKTPPTTNDSNETILVKNISTLGNSVKNIV
jgi:hypothetical protein